MAAGTVAVFDEAKAYMIDDDWASTDNIAIQLILATSTPAVGNAAPALGSYNEATSTEGQQTLDTLANCVTEVGGTMTFDDTGATVVWAQGAGLSTTCRWALIFNTTRVGKEAVAFVDLGANVDLTAGSLTITWDALGIFTIA